MVHKDDLTKRYQAVRRFTEQLCEPLVTEDYVIQSMPDVSPTKWHLAHTTWFWETFLLAPALPGYNVFHPQYASLFNSYYNSLGKPYPRAKRGLLSRPTVEEIYAYRQEVDQRVLVLLKQMNEQQFAEFVPIITLGLHHEQQHQELLLTDIKHVLSCNPLHPVYFAQTNNDCAGQDTRNELDRPASHLPRNELNRHGSPLPRNELRGRDQSGPYGIRVINCGEPDRSGSSCVDIPALEWISYPGGMRSIGYEGDDFCFDNERPRHSAFVQAFQLASRLVTNGEYLQFMEDGGYHNPLLWLSDGWQIVQQGKWEAPLYWEKVDDHWQMMTLHGFHEVNMAEPVCHVSYYEADAYARWSQARLPTEQEWETAAQNIPIAGNFAEQSLYHPMALHDASLHDKPTQMYGDVWEWTMSAYLPYPGYKPAAGAIGEYNGKFMCSQFVLRGGSCATSQTHIRLTYRNFFPPHARWQFTGIRLAQEVP